VKVEVGITGITCERNLGWLERREGWGPGGGVLCKGRCLVGQGGYVYLEEQGSLGAR